MGNNPAKLGSSSTAEEAAGTVRLDDKVAIVTGANTGIGKETARVLAKIGAHVIMACRDMEKCKEAAKLIKEEAKSEKVETMELDLASFDSITTFVNDFKAKKLPLQLLINNAGVMRTPLMKTKQGFELQFGVNHIGHYLLTRLLLPKLIASTPSRVVVLSSGMHKSGHINLGDPNYEKRSYSAGGAYGQSKLANLLFARELNNRLKGTGVTANSVHPGVIATELGRYDAASSIFYSISKPFLKSIPQGAATTVFVATSPTLEGVGGKYFSDCKETIPSNEAQSDELAVKLWDMTEKLIEQKAGAEIFKQLEKDVDKPKKEETKDVDKPDKGPSEKNREQK